MRADGRRIILSTMAEAAIPDIKDSSMWWAQALGKAWDRLSDRQKKFLVLVLDTAKSKRDWTFDMMGMRSGTCILPGVGNLVLEPCVQFYRCDAADTEAAPGVICSPVESPTSGRIRVIVVCSALPANQTQSVLTAGAALVDDGISAATVMDFLHAVSLALK